MPPTLPDWRFKSTSAPTVFDSTRIVLDSPRTVLALPPFAGALLRFDDDLSDPDCARLASNPCRHSLPCFVRSDDCPRRSDRARRDYLSRHRREHLLLRYEMRAA